MPDGLFANPLHWVILLVVVLIIFGPGKLPSVGTALGKSVREFRKATREDDGSEATSTPVEAGAISAPALTSATDGAAAESVRPADAKVPCPVCATVNHASNRFCAHCGKPIDQTVISV